MRVISGLNDKLEYLPVNIKFKALGVSFKIKSNYLVQWTLPVRIRLYDWSILPSALDMERDLNDYRPLNWSQCWWIWGTVDCMKIATHTFPTPRRFPNFRQNALHA